MTPSLPSIALLVFIWANNALAHTPTAENVASARPVDLFSVLVLGALACVYALGQWRVSRRARSRWNGRAVFFWTGWASLALALGPPLDAWSAVSFAAHMTQHELMMLVSAPLLVAARPLGTFLWALPASFASIFKSRAMRRAGLWVSAPLAAWAVHALVLWAWHVPIAFEAGLRSTPVHWLQHVSFFAAAVIYWWSIFPAHSAGEGKAVALLSVFTTAIHTSVLGVLLTFSNHVWYPTYAGAANPWALSALEDQQLGGLIMWVPGGMVFLLLGLVLTSMWLKQSEMRAAR